MFGFLKKLFPPSETKTVGEKTVFLPVPRRKTKESDFDQSEPKSKGSVAISPLIERWRHLGNTHIDVLQRLELYNIAEDIFDSEPIAYTAAERFANGAIGKQGPVITSIELQDHLLDEKTKNPLNEEDAIQLAMAKTTIAFVWSKITTSLLKRIALELYQFGNLPIRIEFDPNRNVSELTVLPPHAFQINSDINHRFKKGQKDCYVQYDTTNPSGQPIGIFSEDEIVFARYGKRSWHRYGFPPIFRVAQECQDLRKDIANLSDARDALMPEVDYLIGKGQSEGLDTKALDDFKKSLESDKVNIGWINKYRRRILTGGSDAKVVNPGVDYVNHLEDLVIHTQRICAAFNMPYALVMQDSRISDRVYQFLLETLYYFQGLYTAEIEHEVIRPIFKLALKKVGVDADRLKINFMWFETQLPTRLQAKAESAVKFSGSHIGLNREPVIDSESVRQAVCSWLNLDPRNVDKAAKNEAIGPLPPDSENKEDKADFPSLQGDALSDPEAMDKYKRNQAAGTASHLDIPKEDGFEPQIVPK